MSMGAAFSATSCTAHSWPEPSLIVARIASVNGCPVTATGATSTFCTSPSSLNAATPAPPSRSTRGRPAMRFSSVTAAGAGGDGAGGGRPPARPRATWRRG